MRIVYTDQSFESLEESIQFLLKVQKVPLEKVLEIKKQLLDKATSLTTDPHVGQYEEYLEHLEKGRFNFIYKFK